MTKKQLYIIIVFLCAVLLYVLFIPIEKEERTVVQEIESTPPEETQEVGTEEVSKQPEPELEKKETPEEVIVLEGIFVGFVDGADVYDKKYKYMLLNDGMEVLRIDLRPLVGYSNLNLIQKLGVERGDQVKITGVMHEGEFKIQNIE